MQGDRVEMIRRLAAVSYYRLSGYWYTYRTVDEQFRPGTSIRTIWDLYVFDRKLRLLVMDAIERIEVAVRTRLAYEVEPIHSPQRGLQRNVRRFALRAEQYEVAERRSVDSAAHVPAPSGATLEGRSNEQRGKAFWPRAEPRMT